MEAQRWRLSMFASCAWFWEWHQRIETAGAHPRRHPCRADARRRCGTGLEARLRADLAAAGIVVP